MLIDISRLDQRRSQPEARRGICLVYDLPRNSFFFKKKKERILSAGNNPQNTFVIESWEIYSVNMSELSEKIKLFMEQFIQSRNVMLVSKKNYSNAANKFEWWVRRYLKIVISVVIHLKWKFHTSKKNDFSEEMCRDGRASRLQIFWTGGACPQTPLPQEACIFDAFKKTCLWWKSSYEPVWQR